MISEDEPAPDAARLRKTPPPSSANDVTNPDLHADGKIFQMFKKLLADKPVWWNPIGQDDGFWAVGGYDAVSHVLKHPDIFSADVKNGGNRIFNAQSVTASPARMILALDPPDHTDLRKAIAPFFTPEVVANQASMFRTRAGRLIDRIKAKGRAEFVSEFSEPYTMGLATSLMGLPEEMEPALLRWTSMLIGDDDPELQPSLADRRATFAEIDDFAIGLFNGSTPTTTDLLPTLRRASPGGVPLDFNEFSINFLFLSSAFAETTRHVITNTIVALDAFPELRATLTERPDLIPSAAKDLIRWTSPLFHVRRTAMRDIEFSGAQIRKGQKVVVWFGAANRDSSKWHDPDSVVADRFVTNASPASMAFGAGPHFCLGWRYAELEMAIMLETLIDRVPDIRCVSPPQYIRSNFVCGIKRLEIACGA